MVKKHTVFLLLGSNIHSRTTYISKAIDLIGNSLGDVTAISSLYESEPWGFEASVAFLNRIVCLETVLTSLEILKKTKDIEQQSGRTSKASGKYTSRTLDIDILFFDDEIIQLPELTIPHAQIANRRFTLLPLTEVAPERRHPVLKKTCRQLLDECSDTGKVWKFKKDHVHAI